MSFSRQNQLISNMFADSFQQLQTHNWQQATSGNNYGHQIPTNYGQQVPTNYGQQASTNYGQQFPNYQQVPTNYGQPASTNYEQQFPNYQQVPNYQEVPNYRQFYNHYQSSMNVEVTPIKSCEDKDCSYHQIDTQFTKVYDVNDINESFHLWKLEQLFNVLSDIFFPYANACECCGGFAGKCLLEDANFCSCNHNLCDHSTDCFCEYDYIIKTCEESYLNDAPILVKDNDGNFYYEQSALFVENIPKKVNKKSNRKGFRGMKNKYINRH